MQGGGGAAVLQIELKNFEVLIQYGKEDEQSNVFEDKF
jgi:hypothetical protein